MDIALSIHGGDFLFVMVLSSLFCASFSPFHLIIHLHHLAVLFPVTLLFLLHTSPLYSFAAHPYPSSHSSPLLWMSCTFYLSSLSFTIFPLFPVPLVQLYVWVRSQGCCVLLCYINSSCWCFGVKQEEKASPGRKTCRRSACCHHYNV